MQKQLWMTVGALCLALAFSSLATAAPEIDSVIKKVKETHTFTMGYRQTIKPTSFLNDEHQPDGYAVDMCKQIVADLGQQLGIDDIKIKYVPVNIQNRIPLVANGTVDIA